jgi:hypothetical protein
MNNEVLILILNYITSDLNKLNELNQLVINDKIPKKLIINNPAHEQLSPQLKKIFHERYRSMLLRYITFLKNILID